MSVSQLRTVFSKGRKVLVRNEKGFFYQEGEIVKMAVRSTTKKAEEGGGAVDAGHSV